MYALWIPKSKSISYFSCKKEAKRLPIPEDYFKTKRSRRVKEERKRKSVTENRK